MCSSYLPLGVSQKSVHALIKPFSSAVAGEAKDVFTRGVLLNLFLYFVFSLLSFFFLVLFASFYQKLQKNSLVWFAFFIQKHKKISSCSSCCCCFWLAPLCQNELCREHQVV